MEYLGNPAYRVSPSLPTPSNILQLCTPKLIYLLPMLLKEGFTAGGDCSSNYFCCTIDNTLMLTIFPVTTISLFFLVYHLSQTPLIVFLTWEELKDICFPHSQISWAWRPRAFHYFYKRYLKLLQINRNYKWTQRSCKVIGTSNLVPLYSWIATPTLAIVSVALHYVSLSVLMIPEILWDLFCNKHPSRDMWVFTG